MTETTKDPLVAPLAEVTELELMNICSRMTSVANALLDSGQQRVASVYLCLAVRTIQEQQRRDGLLEHARREAEDDDGLAGGLLSDEPLGGP
jgi:hypothetical protein